MSSWKTKRSFHINQPMTINGKDIPSHALYSLKQTPKGVEYWQAFWKEQGKMRSVHIGKELPFDEPRPVPSVDELLLTVSKLEDENKRLKDKIKELEESQQRDTALLSDSTMSDSGMYTKESVHIKTFLGMDNKLRVESAVLILEYKGKAIRVQLYPDEEFNIQYRPGKKLWKSLEQEEARKTVRKWKKDEITFTFIKSEYPNRVVESMIEAVVTSKDCKNILF